MKKLTFKVIAVLLALALLGLQGVKPAHAGVKPMVAAGIGHSLALMSDGTVWAWGLNNHGQLGDGTTANKSTPVQVKNLTGVVAVAAGKYHSLALKSDGTVWAWGFNYSGQLGDGTTTDRTTPVQVQNLTGVVAIAAGKTYSLALKSDGTVWAWGYNGYGQLGDGTTTKSATPVQVQNLTEVVAIAAGGYHSLALKSDGTVWAWGYNGYGQLGDGTCTNRTIPVQVRNLTGVVAIEAGDEHSLAVKSDGTAWAWGRNLSGGLGSGTTADSSTPVQVKDLTNSVAIAGGAYHSLALKSDGTVWAWGNNGDGELGNGTTTSRAAPVLVLNLTKVVAIAAGGYHSLALKSDGTVWAWGDNSIGQLGDGTTTDKTIPVQVQISGAVPESITATPSSINLLSGQTQQLTITAQMPDGSTVDVTNQASYQSDNLSVAQVSSSGLVTAVGAGTANITVTYQGKTATVPVTVREVTAITVSPDSINLLVGQTKQLIVTAQISDGTTQDVTAQASYTSSNPSIASVSQDGVVTANSAGVATITVSYQGKTAAVSVLSALPVAVVDYLTVNPSSVSLSAGDTQPISVAAHYSDGTTKDVTASASYQVSDPSVVSVSGGQITALNSGTATITVSYDGKTATITVSVAGQESPSSGQTGPQVIPSPPRPGAPARVSPRPVSNPVVVPAPQRPGAPVIGERPVSNPAVSTVERPTPTSSPAVVVPYRTLISPTVIPSPTRSQTYSYTVIPKTR